MPTVWKETKQNPKTVSYNFELRRFPEFRNMVVKPLANNAKEAIARSAPKTKTFIEWLLVTPEIEEVQITSGHQLSISGARICLSAIEEKIKETFGDEVTRTIEISA